MATPYCHIVTGHKVLLFIPLFLSETWQKSQKGVYLQRKKSQKDV
jgi:hypothetical protein